VVSGDTPRSAGWGAPTVTLRGDAASAPGSPEGYPLWLVRGELQPGASLRWDDAHGDEILFVARGELRVGPGGDGSSGRVCPEGGAVILEAGVPLEVSADGGAEILHFGPADPAPPAAGHFGPSANGTEVHIVGPGGTWAQIEEGRDTRFFADSTCATCRPTLLYTGRDTGPEGAYESPPHSHSQDELIHVLHGELQLGAMTAHAGDTLAISGDVRYKFRSPGPGFGFLNYRRDVSLMTTHRTDPPILEGGEGHGFTAVMDYR
jgi:quercetin dioxygenase-like cupin family protein